MVSQFSWAPSADRSTAAPLAISSQVTYRGAAAVPCDSGAAINATTSSPPKDVDRILSSFRGSLPVKPAMHAGGSGHRTVSTSAAGAFAVASRRERHAEGSSQGDIGARARGGDMPRDDSDRHAAHEATDPIAEQSMGK